MKLIELKDLNTGERYITLYKASISTKFPIYVYCDKGINNDTFLLDIYGNFLPLKNVEHYEKGKDINGYPVYELATYTSLEEAGKQADFDNRF